MVGDRRILTIAALVVLAGFLAALIIGISTAAPLS
jgi:hypothetical protein